MSEPEDIGKLMDIEETAAFFGVSTWTIRRWCALRNGRRKLGHFKVGKRITISSNEATRVLRQSERPRLQDVA
jgi:predicted site-specific integrase-resolvase